MTPRKSRGALQACALCIALLAAGPAFAQFEKIAVSVSAPTIAGNNYHIALTQLALKKAVRVKTGVSDMVLGRKFADTNRLEIYPLANIDIFAQMEGAANPRKIGIKEWLQLAPDGEVTVIIPFKVIGDFYKGSLRKTIDPTTKKLYYWDGENSVWTQIKNYGVQLNGLGGASGYIYFKVVDWPTDDRVIGCD